MDAVTALGYLRLGAADLGSWRDFATSVIGLQPGDGAASPLGDGTAVGSTARLMMALMCMLTLP